MKRQFRTESVAETGHNHVSDPGRFGAATIHVCVKSNIINAAPRQNIIILKIEETRDKKKKKKKTETGKNLIGTKGLGSLP
jgi:hypothetical protein